MRNSIRVLIAALRSAAGGNRVYATELVRGLALRPDIELIIASNLADAPSWRQAAPTARLIVRDVAPLPWGLPAERGWLRTAVAQSSPDIVHDPLTLFPFLRLGARTVATVADLNFRELSLGAARTAYKRMLYAHAVRHVDLLLCMSEFTREVLCKAYPAAAAKAQVFACGHGYGDLIDEASADQPAQRFLLTFAHRAHKNAEAAVRIVGKLSARFPDLRLTVVGGVESTHADLLALAGELGVRERIDVLGKVDQAVLRVLYRQALCLVFLSRYEGFGLPVLEAMALGCPVISSDRGALPELVQDYGAVFDCGAWPTAASFVAELALKPELRAAIAQRARRYAARCTWDRTVERTVECYEWLVARRARPMLPLRETGAARVLAQ